MCPFKSSHQRYQENKLLKKKHIKFISADRLNGLAIYAKNGRPSSNTYFDSGKCNELVGQAQGGAYILPCFAKANTVVARIDTDQPTNLTICEIEVYGKYSFFPHETTC